RVNLLVVGRGSHHELASVRAGHHDASGDGGGGQREGIVAGRQVGLAPANIGLQREGALESGLGGGGLRGNTDRDESEGGDCEESSEVFHGSTPFGDLPFSLAWLSPRVANQGST